MAGAHLLVGFDGSMHPPGQSLPARRDRRYAKASPERLGFAPQDVLASKTLER